MHFRTLLSLTIAGIGGFASTASCQQGDQASRRGGLPSCEWCGAMDAPEGLASSMTIAEPDEPGQRIILRGRIFEPDGETPASGVMLYAYHTDITGVYRKDGDETGNGLRHGALRGWLVTDGEGRYEIRTIKPEPYPSRNEAAHIHVTLTPPGGDEEAVHSFEFADDSLVTRRDRRRSEDAGRFGWVMDLAPNEDGVLVGERDIRLQK